MLSLALLLVAERLPFDGPVRGNGVCVGPAWVALTSTEKATFERGPDGGSYIVANSEGRRWSTWWGQYALVADPKEVTLGPIVLRKGNWLVRRVLLQQKATYWFMRGRRLPDGRTMTVLDSESFAFSGPIFSGTARDLSFLNRVSFGGEVDARCRLFWRQWR